MVKIKIKSCDAPLVNVKIQCCNGALVKIKMQCCDDRFKIIRQKNRASFLMP